MAVNLDPSSTTYCSTCVQDTSGGASSGIFLIKRHDTCPLMEIDVKGLNDEPVDLTGWTAIGILYFKTLLYADLPASLASVTVELESVANAGINDVLRFEAPDANRELALVTAIDRQNDNVTVTREYNSSPLLAHYNDDTVIGIRADDIPITWHSVSVPDYRADAEDGDTLMTRSYLKVNWRTTDTAQSGAYLLEIQLTGPDGEKLTLPRSGGFNVKILSDSEDQ